MSMVLTRSPLEPLGMMNGGGGGGTQKRRSARLSHDGGAEAENEPPVKKSRGNGGATTTTTTMVNTKGQDGDANGLGRQRKGRKVYDEEVDGFAFKKGSRRGKEGKGSAVRNSMDERPVPGSAVAPAVEEMPSPPPPPPPKEVVAPKPASGEDAAPEPPPRKTRRRFPTTPEREAKENPVRRSKRISNDDIPPPPQPSPQRPAHSKSHANTERSPSPEKARPVTVEKKRKRGANGAEEEEKIMRIALPFQDTPIIRRNKEMRKESTENVRRSSSGMRGRRASSMIDEGRGNEASEILSAARGRSNSNQPPVARNLQASILPPSKSTLPVVKPNEETLSFKSDEDASADKIAFVIALPHAEVPTAEFFKHISADLTEPRRMRCLLGWCGTRALPAKPEAPKESTAAANLEFQALQAARVIQEELSQDLVIKGTLSDWFSRDETAAPPIPLRKKPNPRNLTNAAKAEELERELERLKKERAEWNELMKTAVPLPASPAKAGPQHANDNDGQLSPLRPDLLDSPERAIAEQLQAAPAPDDPSTTDPAALQHRLRQIAESLEFDIDQFAQGIHTLGTARATAERLADRRLAAAAEALEERERVRKREGKGVDGLDALRALGRVLNPSRRR